MSRMRRMLSLVITTIVAAAVLVVPAFADEPSYIWNDPTHKITLDLSTLTVDKDVAYPSDTITVSVEGTAPTGVHLTLRYGMSHDDGSYSSLSHDVDLFDDDGDGTFEGTIEIREDMGTGTLSPSGLMAYRGDAMLFQVYPYGEGMGVVGDLADLTGAKLRVEYAPGDDNKPEIDLSTLSVSTKEAAPGDVVTVSMRATDDYYFDPEDLTVSVSYSMPLPTSGTKQLTVRLTDEDGDGLFTGTIELGDAPLQGTYVVTNMAVTDRSGNVVYYYQSNCPEFEALSFTVTGGETDTTPPVINMGLARLQLTREPVMQGDVIVYQIGVTDDVAVDSVTLFLLYNGSTSRAFNLTDKGNGLWEANVTMDPGYGYGDYGIHTILATDTSGNQAIARTEDSWFNIGDLVDLSAYDFTFGEEPSAPEDLFNLDFGSVTLTPTEAVRYQSITAQFDAAGPSEISRVSVYYDIVMDSGTGRNSLNYYVTSKDGDRYTAVAAANRHMPLGEFQALQVTVYDTQGRSMTYYPLDSGQGYFQGDVSAFDLVISEWGTTDYRTKPVASSVTTSPKEVTVGDTVTFELDVEGERPASEVNIGVVSTGSNTRYFPMQSEDGRHFTAQLEIDDKMANGTWYVYVINVTDITGIYYQMRDYRQTSSDDVRADLSAADFTVSGSPADPNVEQRPQPIKDGCYVIPSTLHSGDPMRLELRSTSEEKWDVFVTYLCPDGVPRQRFFQMNDQGYVAKQGTPQEIVGSSVPGTYSVCSVQFRNDHGSMYYYSYNDNFREMGLDKLNFTVVDDAGKKSLGDAELNFTVETYDYSGRAITPPEWVNYDGRNLRRGTDYMLVYEDNVNAGKGRVIAVGMGDYIGACMREFTINRVDISNATVSQIPAQTYTPDLGPHPQIVVTLGDKTLVEGVDYQLGVIDNQVVGTARVNIMGIGNYRGSIQTSYEVTGLDISGADAVVDDVSYAGGDELPHVELTLEGKRLVLGKDFVVELQRESKLGVAKAVVTGIRGCIGRLERMVNVLKGDISKATVEAEDQVWTGDEVTTTVTVTLGGKTLEEGVDYTLSYRDNVDVGQATVIATGIDAFEGEAVGTFNIGNGISAAELSGLEDMPYDGKPKEPEPVVTLDGVQLTKGVDYTLSYEDNVDAGQATVIVSGTGSYAGEVRGTFAITPLDIDAVVWPQEDEVWNVQFDRARGTVLPKIKNGRVTLFSSQDYLLFAKPITPNDDGTFALEVTYEGRNNYCGTAVRVVTILPYELKDGDLLVEDIPDQAYTGEEVEPEVVITTSFGTMIPYGSESGPTHTVTYENNVEPGTAKAIVTYNGVVVGTVEKEFRIVVVDKTALEQAIGEAREDRADTVVSNDGKKDAATGKEMADKARYVSQADADKLDQALEVAQAVLDNPRSTQDEVDEATATLTAAKEAFDRAKKTYEAVTLIPIYRMYNTKTSEHLWTKSKAEYNACGTGNYKDWRQENVAWYSPNLKAPANYAQSTQGNYVYVWRLYDKGRTGDHIYLTYGAEMKSYLANGWVVDKGAGFWTVKKGTTISGRTTIPIYRAYNYRLGRGKHHYTPSKTEYDTICKKYGWKPEGVKFYVIKK